MIEIYINYSDPRLPFLKPSHKTLHHVCIHLSSTWPHHAAILTCQTTQFHPISGRLPHLTSFRNRTPSFLRHIFVSGHIFVIGYTEVTGLYLDSPWACSLSIQSPQSGYLNSLLATCFCKWGLTKTQPHVFIYILGCFPTKMAVCNCDRDNMAGKDYNIHYLALYRRSPPTPALNGCMASLALIWSSRDPLDKGSPEGRMIITNSWESTMC